MIAWFVVICGINTTSDISKFYVRYLYVMPNITYKSYYYLFTLLLISIGNSMICSDIWHKYHEWYFKIVIRNLRQFWNITSGIYAKYHVQIMLLFVYTTTRKRFVIFTCRYFKLRWNTTALSQSNCRNFSCSSRTDVIASLKRQKIKRIFAWIKFYKNW